MPLPLQERIESTLVGSSSYDYLHSVRAFLLLLGLLLHAALFCTSGSDAFTTLHDLIHSFRMEGFFLLSGLFSAYTISKVSSVGFALRRCERLGIPLVVCGSAFALQNYVAVLLGHQPTLIMTHDGAV